MNVFTKYQWLLFIGFMAVVGVLYAEFEAPESAPSAIKVISSGNQSLSLDQQLHDVAPPTPQQEELQTEAAKPEVLQHLPESVGNAAKITQLQQELETAFQKADQEAKGFSKAEQFSLYLLYKQAEQNQLLLAQNNEILSILRQIKSQNHSMVALVKNNNYQTAEKLKNTPL